jgi:hypothetical protein
LNSQLFEKLFTEGAIVSRCEPQHIPTNVGRIIDYVTFTTGAKLLLANIFLEFFVTFDISDFGGFPCFAKQQPSLFGVDCPECVGDSRERTRAQCFVVEGACIAREGDE